MADNTQLNTGTGGDVIATDDIGGVKHQMVKLEYGALDSATLVSTSNPLPVTLANTGANATAVKVDNSAVTQPVSASALPLPTGASTETTLAAIKAKTDNLDVLLSTRTKPADAQHVIVDSGVTTGLTDTQLRATAVPVTANAGTNLNTSALALDSTVAKDASLTTINTSVNALLKPASTLTAVTTVTNLSQLGGVAIAMGTGVRSTGTQRVTIATDDLVPISAASLPLPSLAATSTKQSDGTQKTQVVDGAGNVIGATSNALDVNIKSGSSAGTQYADGTAAATPTGTQANWNEAGTQRATSLAKPLPIQAGTGVTLPVSLATAPTTPVTGTFWQSTQPVSLATNTPTLAAGTNIAGKFGIDQTTDGTTNKVFVGNIPHVIVDTAPSTAVTGTVTANAGTNLNTSALVTSANLTSGTQKTQIVDGSGNVISSTSNALNVAVPNTTVTSTITATQAVNLSSTGLQTVSINVSGTWTGTLQPQLSVDGTNYGNVGVIPFASASASVSSITANGNYWVVVAGTKNFQVLGATVASGTATVVINGSQSGFGQLAVQSVAANLKMTNTTDQTSHGTTDLVAADITKIAGTAPTTVGKLDVKGADGDVFVRQATGSNLHTVLDTGSTTAVTQATAANLNATVVGTGTFAVQAAATLAAETTKVIGTVNVAAAQSIAVTQATGTNLHTVVDSGTITAVTAITNALPTGTNAIGTVQPGNTQNTTPWLTAPSASTGAVGTSMSYTAALTNTKVAVKASAGNLYGYHIYNPNPSVVYIQFFNIASGSVTLGTTPPTMQLVVPPNGWVDAPSTGPPIGFNTAITMAATTLSGGSLAPTSTLVANVWFI